jgi:pimeloyl-ACP methyl ester carboxylesterase
MKLFLDLLVLLSALSCLEGGKSFVIQPKKWDYRGHDIAFEVSRRAFESGVNGTDFKRSSSSEYKEPILLLNGFGVGSFHQHRLIPQILQEEGNDSQVVYCVDYLGQGASWPKDCKDGFSDNERGLRYSAETWIDQLSKFIEEVILPEHPDGHKVHVVGNSIGGHLAAHLAYQRPDLVESICLLNPTPVWGLNLPGWSGHLPPPKVPKAIGRYLFDKIRDPDIIEKYLDNAYARKEAYNDELVCHYFFFCLSVF